MTDTTEKANQHFVPKFYFRNFSYQNNQREIGIFNIKSKFYKPNVSIRHQGSKRFFYGKDGELEEFFCLTEKITSPIIRNIIFEQVIPIHLSADHFELLFFFILLEERNPVHLNMLRDFLIQQFDYMNNLDDTFLKEKDKEKFPDFISNENLHKLIFKNSLDIARLNMDLEYKILLNKTKNPFITSDFPVVRYNQLMENFDWNFSSYTGNGWIGMQMYIPLSEKYTIIFYDNTTYKVGNKKEKFVELNDCDVEQLNLLQIINCNQNLYFNENVNKNYIEKLIKIRENIDYSHKGILKEYNDDNNPNSVIVGITKPNIRSKLKISKIKIHSGAQNFTPTNEAIQFRKKAKKMYDHIQNKKKLRLTLYLQNAGLKS